MRNRNRVKFITPTSYQPGIRLANVPHTRPTPRDKYLPRLPPPRLCPTAQQAGLRARQPSLSDTGVRTSVQNTSPVCHTCILPPSHEVCVVMFVRALNRVRFVFHFLLQSLAFFLAKNGFVFDGWSLPHAAERPKTKNKSARIRPYFAPFPA